VRTNSPRRHGGHRELKTNLSFLIVYPICIALQGEEIEFSQGLKPKVYEVGSGTAEAVPFQTRVVSYVRVAK
jgi:hypothetical protein